MESKPIHMVCRDCGSTEVVSDATASWDTEKQDWAVHNTFDKGAWCDECDGETRLDAVPLENIKDGHYVDTD